MPDPQIAVDSPWVLLVPALLAALGYLGKLLIEGIDRRRETRRRRHAQLSRLQSLLEAGRTAFEIQCENRNRLSAMLHRRMPTLQGGYEERFVQAYDEMEPRERALHTLIRGITEHTIKPLNEALLEWLEEDEFFRALEPSLELSGQLSVSLDRLHAHLVLWRAKYKSWFEASKKHALVYLADEERHGLGFPQETQGLVEAMLGLPLRQDQRVELLAGDIVFTRGTSLLSRAIRLFSQAPTQGPAKVNHIGIIVEGGLLREAVLVEALTKVRRHRLVERYGPPSSTSVAVFRPRVEAIAAAKWAEGYVGRSYGYWKLLAHLLDWPLFGKKLFRRLIRGDDRPICSWLVAEAFEQVQEDFFGGSPHTMSPDDLWDAVEYRPQSFKRVRPLARVRQRW